MVIFDPFLKAVKNIVLDLMTAANNITLKLQTIEGVNFVEYNEGI
jgi:hypothetical protein